MPAVLIRAHSVPTGTVLAVVREQQVEHVRIQRRGAGGAEGFAWRDNERSAIAAQRPIIQPRFHSGIDRARRGIPEPQRAQRRDWGCSIESSKGG